MLNTKIATKLVYLTEIDFFAETQSNQVAAVLGL